MAIFKVYELVKINRCRKNIEIYRIIIDGKDIHGFGCIMKVSTVVGGGLC